MLGIEQYPASLAGMARTAYTVLGSAATHQFYTGDETFGPRWTSLMDPQRVPLLLVRQYGRSEVAIAQLSACRFPARAEPPQFLHQFVNNVASLGQSVIRTPHVTGIT